MSIIARRRDCFRRRRMRGSSVCSPPFSFGNIRPNGCIVTAIATLNEALSGAERVRDTPLPEAYSIAISQIAWIYILVLPFQLVGGLNWLAIPGSVGTSSYIYKYTYDPANN